MKTRKGPGLLFSLGFEPRANVGHFHHTTLYWGACIANALRYHWLTYSELLRLPHNTTQQRPALPLTGPQVPVSVMIERALRGTERIGARNEKTRLQVERWTSRLTGEAWQRTEVNTNRNKRYTVIKRCCMGDGFACWVPPSWALTYLQTYTRGWLEWSERGGIREQAAIDESFA